MSKLHMVLAWTTHLDKEMTGHSARRSGAMLYARAGMPIPSIQFLGRWKSSAVFRYIEEAMTEMPLNATILKNSEEEEKPLPKEICKRKALRPKAKPTPSEHSESPQKSPTKIKPLVPEGAHERVFAVSKSRSNWTRHTVGQAAWGIPLDNWTTLCGWNFARKNVKVELTKHPSRLTRPCKKCQKLEMERDGVRGAREWAHLMSFEKASADKQKP